MGRRSLVRERSASFVHLTAPWWLLWALALLLPSWPDLALAMPPDRVARLRRETVDMFYHGFDNYMQIAFPEDEVSPGEGEAARSPQPAASSPQPTVPPHPLP